MKRTENALDAKQVLTVIERYNTALDLLKYGVKSLASAMGI